MYDWAAGKFGLPTEGGLAKWILFRKNIESGDCAYYFCLAPKDSTDQDLAIASGQGWNIECCFESCKAEDKRRLYHRGRRIVWRRKNQNQMET
jgi:hypothetical protein